MVTRWQIKIHKVYLFKVMRALSTRRGTKALETARPHGRVTLKGTCMGTWEGRVEMEEPKGCTNVWL